MELNTRVDTGSYLERTPSIEERLNQRRERLTHELRDVEAAIEALRQNPEVMKVINLISKAGY